MPVDYDPFRKMYEEGLYYAYGVTQQEKHEMTAAGPRGSILSREMVAVRRRAPRQRRRRP